MARPSLIGLLEAIRDDATLREVIGAQIRHRSHAVAEVICGRAVARGEIARSDMAGTILDLAFALLFGDTLLRGRPHDAPGQARLVGDVLLPLLRSPERRRDAQSADPPAGRSPSAR